MAGEDSLTSALREVKEELGIELDINNGYLYKTFMMQHTRFDEGGAFYDVWIFNQDIDLKDIKLQEEETADEKYASKEEILCLVNNNEFLPVNEVYPYLYDLLGNE